MMNIKNLFFLSLFSIAFAMPAFAADTDPHPVVEGMDPKAVSAVPSEVTDGEGHTSPWALRIPSVTFVAGAYRELYENKVGDVVKIENDGENPVNDGNIITGINVSVIQDENKQNLTTRRIQYTRDNVKIPVKGDNDNGWDSTTNYTSIWVE